MCEEWLKLSNGKEIRMGGAEFEVVTTPSCFCRTQKDGPAKTSPSLQKKKKLPTLSMSAARGTQDLPPAGGYPQVQYRRYLPNRGPSGFVILAGITAFCTFGFYRVYQGNAERR